MEKTTEKTYDSTEKSSSPKTGDDASSTATAEITIVTAGEKSYTKITPAQSQPPNSSPPPKPDTQTTQENRTKRLKEDPHLRHLHLQGRIKAPLLRSSSMPVSVEDDAENDKSNQNEKSGMLLHRKIYRTGSISDYTKQKLKSTILMRTSASLVRKPSITDFEMRHIAGDADSSQSDEEDDEEEKDYKFSSTAQEEDHGKRSGETSFPSHAITSTCKNAQGPAAESLSASLPEATVTLSVAITSA